MSRQLASALTSPCCYVCKIHIASHCPAVPAEHQRNSFQKLGAATLVNAAGVHPEVLQAIVRSLLITKAQLLVFHFRQPQALSQVCKAHFFVIFTPGIREDRVQVGQELVVAKILSQAEAAIPIKLQEPHRAIQAL
jgi:hypothetical protein